MKRKIKKGAQRIIASFLLASTIMWSLGTSFLTLVPTARAVAPMIEMVQYLTPNSFEVRFNQAMNEGTISTGSFTLSTSLATDNETITEAVAMTAGNPAKTSVKVTASGAKISPSFEASKVIVATSGLNAPKNLTDEANTDGGMIGITMPPGEMVISEIKLSGSSATDEFIELYNRYSGPVDISNWKLAVLDASGTETTLFVFGATLPIAPGTFRLIGPTGTIGSDETYAPGAGGISANGIEANNTIILYRNISGPIFKAEDIVGCGSAIISEGMTAVCPTTGASMERKASSASTSATMASGGGEVGKGNSNDTNSNNFDFVSQAVPVPQNSAVSETASFNNQPPNIMHMPVSQVPANTDAIIFADFMDPETPQNNLTANLTYSTDNKATWKTPLVGQYQAGSGFKFTVLAADVGVGVGTAFQYYLKVTDGNSASTCMWATGMGPCGDETGPKAGAWVVSRIDGSGWANTIKGRIMSGATGINNVNVTLRGAGMTFNTMSAADGADLGAFTFANVPAGMFRVEASAPGYMDGWFDGAQSKPSGAAYSDIIVNLTVGSGGGGGGDMNSPMVMWSAPMDGMMGAPTKINISNSGMPEAPVLVGFSKDMDSATITGDNIKLYTVTSSGLGTDLLASVAYQPQGGSATLTDRNSASVNMGPDRKAILYSATALTANSQYAVVLTNGVKDTAGNPLQGNKPGGGHSIMFSTGADFSGQTTGEMGGNFTTFMAGGGGGEFAPAYVTGSNPGPGMKNVPTNTKIIVNFSKPMDSASINATSSAGTNVKLYDTNYNNTGSGQYITLSSIALDTATKQIATIDAGTLATNHNYAIRVLGGAKSANGMTMAMPGQETNTMYQADFTTGSTADTGAPSALGTNLQMYTTVTPCTNSVCVSGVPANAGVMDISFSKDLDASTVTTSSITLKSGSTTVTTTVQYDPMNRTVKIVPSTVLYTVTNYVLTVGIGVKAMNGTALENAYTVSFTTSSDVDTGLPSIQFANGDDYKMAVTFSEPMNASKATDTASNWAVSVLNPANYIMYTNNNPPPWTEGVSAAKYFNNNNLSTAVDAGTGGPLSFKYDAAYNTVIIEGLKLMEPAIKGGFSLWVKNVKDISGNVIQDNATSFPEFGANTSGGPVMNSKDTFGMIGPGGGGMSGPPPSDMLDGGTMATTAFGGKSPEMMGFKPIGVWPVNMLAGQESMYMIDIPLTQAIPAGGKIVLTFPTGFNVANAQNADVNGEWAHNDINGPGTGKVVLSTVAESTISGGLNNDGVTVNTSARTVTITLGAVATQANDFLHLEIDRIKNTSTATDGDMASGVSMGSGYQVDIYTKNSATTLETLKSMPFFIKKAGSSTLTGTIAFKNAAGANTAVTATVPVYLMSPMTGPLKTTVSFSNSATASYTFSGVPTGSFMLGTEPLQTVSDTDYYADLSPMPQNINIAAGANTKDFNFRGQDNSTKPGVTVNITGTFANESIDIFAGGPQGFSVKTVTLNATYTNASPYTQTFYLPNTGQWMIGMGSAMPRGPQQAGPPPMPNWMPPKPADISVTGTGPGWVWQDTAGAATGDAVNDGKVTFAVTTANKTINGHVYGATGSTGIQNADVFAYSPMGGMGSHAQTKDDGSFSLKITDGSYKIGVFMPGKPPSQEIPVEVKTVGDTTTVYANGVVTTDLVLRTTNPASMLTISGKVTDGTNVMKDASVYARRTNGPGNIGAKTDSMGKYILYVDTNSTWTVGVFLPQYGNLAEQTVAVTTTSQANIDFAPTVGTTFYTVTDRVYKDVGGTVGSYDAGTDTLLSGVHVDFSTATYRNETISQNGEYTIKVPAGTYTVNSWSPAIGKVAPQTVTVAGNMSLTGGADTPISDTKKVTINFVSDDIVPVAVTLDKVYAQMDKLGAKDVSNETTRENASSVTFDVPAGADTQYAIDIDIPGVSDSSLTITSPTAGAVTASDIDGDSVTDIYKAAVVNSDIVLNVAIPNLFTVEGVAKDSLNNPLSNTIINIKKPGTDISTAVKTDSSGNYSVELPASGATPYLFQIDKGGYVDTGLSVPVTVAATQNLDAVKADATITGQIKVGTTGVEGAKVFAKELGGGFASTEADASGNYTLSVTPGNWKISSSSDYYSEKEYQNGSSQDIVVTTATATPQTGIDITLATQKSGLAGLNNSDINPSSGATFSDTSANLEIFAAQNAIATSQSTYQLEDSEVSSITSSPTAKTIGGKAVDIKAYQPSGSKMIPMNESFTSDITIEKKYTKAELVTEGIDTFAEADRVKMSYFDDSASNWEPVPTNVTYLDADDKPVIPTTNLSNVTAVLYAGVSDHMTVYSPTNQAPDGLAPSAPTALAATGTSSSITVTWTAPTTNADSSTLTDLLAYEIYRSTSATGIYTQINAADVTSATYTDTSVTAGSTYYYKVTAADTAGIESAMPASVSGTATASSTPPSGGGGGGSSAPAITGSISINSGAVSTSSTSVTLTLSSSGATKMAISNKSDLVGVSWETYAATKAWTLTTGSGAKTVYAKFMNSAGAISSIVSDSITLGATLAPTSTPTSGNTGSGKVCIQVITPAISPSGDCKVFSTPCDVPEGWTKVAKCQSGVSTPEPDETLIKYPDSPKVYVVKDGKLVWIQTAEEFNKAGYKWDKIKLATAEIKKVVGSVTLLRAEGDSRVYVVHNNVKRHIISASQFNSAGYKWENVKVVSAADVNKYKDAPSYDEGTLFKSSDSPKIYVIKSGKKFWIQTAQAFKAAGYNWDDVITVNADVANAYEETGSESSEITGASGNIVITSPSLRIRSTNSTKGKNLGFVKKGEVYSILEENGNWFKIKTPKGITGWVSGDYAKRQ